jgi:hypothetical protein
MDEHAQSQSPVPDEGTWEGLEDNLDDPEEVRVIFCAIDSFS